MERVKRIAGWLIVMVAVSGFVSVVVFSLMKKDALDKMLAMQEVLVLKSLATDIGAVQNMTRARFQEAEESLYQSLGMNMAFLKQIYVQRGTMPSQTITELIRNVSKYYASSELSRDERFKTVFKKDVLDFMSWVEKAANEAK